MGLLANNSIAWCQYQLRGGLRGVLSTSALYAGAIIAVIVLVARLSDDPVPQTLSGWTTGLLVLQAAILILFGGSRISAAIKADVTARLIESHRLMPITEVEGIVGYIVGSCSQALALAAATFLIGAVTCAMAGLPVAYWVIANAVLATFAVFLWSAIAFSHLVGISAFGILIGLFVFSVNSGGLLAAICPGLLVLASPLHGKSIFQISHNAMELNWTYPAAFAAQGLIGLVFLCGGARKFKRDEALALGVDLGLVLLLLWVGISCVGIAFWRDFAPIWFDQFDVDTDVQLTATLVMSALVATAPVVNAMRQDLAWRWRGVGHHAPRRKPLPPVLVVVVATALLALFAAVARRWIEDPVQDHALLRTAVVVFTFLFGIGYVARWTYLATGAAKVSVLLWMILLTVAPFVVDFIRHLQATPNRDFALSWISTCSPLGALTQIWNNGDQSVDTTLGLGVQVLIAGGAACLYSMSARRLGRPAAAGMDAGNVARA